MELRLHHTVNIGTSANAATHMRYIKPYRNMLDPRSIFNPGKVL
jgi:FAD/FMN-containing dehydrogenase